MKKSKRNMKSKVKAEPMIDKPDVKEKEPVEPPDEPQTQVEEEK